MDEDPEAFPTLNKSAITPVLPSENLTSTIHHLTCSTWPFDGAEAHRRQTADGRPTTRAVPLSDGLALDMVRIPSGEFIMGQADGCADEQPCSRVAIPRPFWMGRCEISNEQFRRFDR